MNGIELKFLVYYNIILICIYVITIVTVNI